MSQAPLQVCHSGGSDVYVSGYKTVYPLPTDFGPEDGDTSDEDFVGSDDDDDEEEEEEDEVAPLTTAVPPPLRLTPSIVRTPQHTVSHGIVAVTVEGTLRLCADTL